MARSSYSSSFDREIEIINAQTLLHQLADGPIGRGFNDRRKFFNRLRHDYTNYDTLLTSDLLPWRDDRERDLAVLSLSQEANNAIAVELIDQLHHINLDNLKTMDALKQRILKLKQELLSHASNDDLDDMRAELDDLTAKYNREMARANREQKRADRLAKNNQQLGPYKAQYNKLRKYMDELKTMLKVKADKHVVEAVRQVTHQATPSS